MPAASSLTKKCFKIVFGRPSRHQSNHPAILISVEGNVGAGKSTLIELLKDRHKDWNFIAEPVDMWSSIKNERGESLLEVYYRDRKRWSYSFQSCALLSRFQNIQNAMTALSPRGGGGGGFRPVFVTERCVDTDYFVFAQMLRDQGMMDKIEFDLYDRLYRHLRTSMKAPLTAIIHVDTSPAECLARIKTRNRAGESNISLDYLTDIEKYQLKWIRSLGDMDVISTGGEGSGPALSDIESFVNRQLVSEEQRKTYNVCL